MKRIVGLLAAAVCLAQAAEKIAGGPMVVNLKGRSATVVWVVEQGSAKLGTTPGAIDKSAPALEVRQTSFSGLAPGKTYYYDVDGSDAGKGSFKTPPSGAEPFEFVVFGDTRTRHDVHRRVIASILKYSEPEFVLHSGDLVSDGYDSAQWPVFFDIERELLRKIAFYPALGNHERNNRQFYDFFQVGTPYYSFDWGTAHFIVLNSDLGNAASTPSAKEAFWQAQKTWFEEDLKASQKASYRFVIAHHPPMTAVSRRQAGNPEMAALLPLFDKYKVTAGFFGHDHNYQHYLKDGIHYVVSGGGGAPLYDVANPPAGITVKATSVEHFCRIRMNGDTAKVAAIGVDGAVLDEFELHASK
ncbi:MAG: metallophosphoesterase [Acidobacteria bacterium]|nr:metallophosphoesterase [Acidobacteriota bacterium]